MTSWQPPASWRKITTIDSHTGGEPFRVILAGAPELEGDTILARRRFAREHHDDLRKALMWEPRGHADMYGCFLTPPVTEEADLGILFIHNEGFSSMCGHGVIAMTKVALETGMLPKVEPRTVVRFDTPAGLVIATAEVQGGRVGRVTFRNVASFVSALDLEVEVPGLGRVSYDLAFGGAFYAYVDARRLGLDCSPAGSAELIAKGKAIKQAVMASARIEHPFEDDLGFLYGVIFVDLECEGTAHSRNVCVFADGEVDRSPTGTGVSGRLAIHHARGEIQVGETIEIESVVGSRFACRVAEETTFGPHAAILPEVTGEAFLTGRHEFWIDPRDELGRGFLMR